MTDSGFGSVSDGSIVTGFNHLPIHRCIFIMLLKQVCWQKIVCLIVIQFTSCCSIVEMQQIVSLICHKIFSRSENSVK